MNYRILLPVIKISLVKDKIILGDVILHKVADKDPKISEIKISDEVYKIGEDPVKWAIDRYIYWGFPCLAEIINLNAQSEDEAIQLSVQKVEFALNQLVLMGFESGLYGFAPMIIQCDKYIKPKFKFVGQSWYYGLYGNIKEKVDLDGIEQKFLGGIDASKFLLKGSDGNLLIVRLKRALDWYRRGKEAEDKLYNFLFFWIGLEQLIESTYNPKGKDSFDITLYRRLSSIKINVSQSLITELYEVRVRIVHEGEDVPEGDLSFAYSHLSYMKDIFIETMVFAFKFVDGQLSRKELWEKKSQLYRLNDPPIIIT